MFATISGAEEGDVLGTIQSALVLGDARDTHTFATTTPLLLSTKASVSSGLLMICRSSCGRGPSMGGTGALDAAPGLLRGHPRRMEM